MDSQTVHIQRGHEYTRTGNWFTQTHTHTHMCIYKPDWARLRVEHWIVLRVSVFKLCSSLKQNKLWCELYVMKDSPKETKGMLDYGFTQTVHIHRGHKHTRTGNWFTHTKYTHTHTHTCVCIRARASASASGSLNRVARVRFWAVQQPEKTNRNARLWLQKRFLYTEHKRTQAHGNDPRVALGA